MVETWLLPSAFVHMSSFSTQVIVFSHSTELMQGANVLLKSTTADARRFTAKLADFGMARLLAENSTHVSTKTYGTISYMPVEVLKHGKLTRAVDSYSFAILMWEMFSGSILYADMTVAQVSTLLVQSLPLALAHTTSSEDCVCKCCVSRVYL